MSAVVNTAVAVVGVSAGSLLGLLTLGMDQERVRTWVPLLASLAAGAVAGGALFELIPEAVARHAGPAVITTGVMAGFVGFWLLERGLHRAVQGDDHPHSRPRYHPIVALNFIGNVLHNAVDGSIIAAAFLTTPTIGVVTTLAIVLHEIPRELGSGFGVFMHGGLSVRRAVWYNGLAGVAALASAAITLSVGGPARPMRPRRCCPSPPARFSTSPFPLRQARSWRPRLVLIVPGGWGSRP